LIGVIASGIPAARPLPDHWHDTFSSARESIDAVSALWIAGRGGGA
jgi:hypothetical protein